MSHLQMVFQNPFDTLNPSHSVGSPIGRVSAKFGIETRRRRRSEARAGAARHRPAAARFDKRRPRQLSGGQKQRIGIARAFAGNPQWSSPTSRSRRSTCRCRRRSPTADGHPAREAHDLVFISHDLSVVRTSPTASSSCTSDSRGAGDDRRDFAPPYHPYTEALLSAVPIADTRITKRKVLSDRWAIPSPVEPASGLSVLNALPVNDARPSATSFRPRSSSRRPAIASSATCRSIRCWRWSR